VGRFSEVLAEVLDRTYAPASRVWLYTDATLSARSPDPVKCVVQLLEAEGYAERCWPLPGFVEPAGRWA
jgi:hypothetical protein